VEYTRSSKHFISIKKWRVPTHQFRDFTGQMFTFGQHEPTENKYSNSVIVACKIDLDKKTKAPESMQFKVPTSLPFIWLDLIEVAGQPTTESVGFD